MPLLRSETVHGVVCKFYDGCVVKVGTTAAARFTIKVPADEATWFSTRLRAELIKRELATATELPVDEAAMAAKAEAVGKADTDRAAQLDAYLKAEASPRKQAAIALEQAASHAQLAESKRKLAEKRLEVAQVRAKVAKVAQAATAAASLAKTIPQAAPLQAKLEAFMVRMPPPVGPQHV